jgi:hypothetical protein
MSTIWHCNKERERTTHLRVKEASWNIVELFEKRWNCPTPPLRCLILAVCFGDSICRFSTCESHQFQAPYGGLAWVALSGAFSQTQELVFWPFLLSYLTSGPFSCWYFLLFKQRFFWYYFSRQVMAILCCVAQKAASAAQVATPVRIEISQIQC